MERDREDIEVLNLPTKVEERIKQIKEDYLAAYIMIDVAGKNGQEMLSEELEKATEEKIKENSLLFEWAKEDDEYILHIRKRVIPEYEYTLRLYQDGNGVVIYESKCNSEINYFRIKEALRKNIVSRVSEKVDYIVSHPEEVHEDDRYFGCPVHCRYGLKWKYNNAYDMLSDYMIYEDCDYGFDEYETEIARMLLEAPEVSSIWMKH